MHLTGVGVDAARQVHGNQDGPVAAGLIGQRRQFGCGLAQPTLTAYPRQAVDDQVSCRDRRPGACCNAAVSPRAGGRGADLRASPGGRAGAEGRATGRTRAVRSCRHPAAAFHQGRLASLVQPRACCDGIHARAASGKPGARIECVAAVVTRAGQDDHLGPVDLAEQAHAYRREARGGPLHEHPVGQFCHQGPLRGPDGRHRVRVPH